MNILHLLRKVPFRIVAGLFILLIGVLILGITLALRSRPQPQTSPSAESPAPPVVDFAPASTVLIGNSLVDTQSGKIISKDWIKGYSSIPPIVYANENRNLVLTRGNNGGLLSFDFRTGSQKPQLTLDGKPLGAFAFNSKFTRTIFVSNGDLWTAEIDWDQNSVHSSSRLTEAGYFRNDAFRSHWLWLGDTLLVPHLVKTLQIDVPTGRVAEIPLNISRLQGGINPDGTFILYQGPDYRTQIIETEGRTAVPLELKLPIRKLLWLTPRKAVLSIGQGDLAIYDHDKKKLSAPLTTRAGIVDIAAPSPTAESFFIAARSGLTLVNTTKQKHVKLSRGFSDVEWISESQFLASCSDLNTESRGVWLVNTDGVETKISNMPVDKPTARQSSSPIIPVADGAALIIGGNLWIYKTASGKLEQKTTGANFPPQLTSLTPSQNLRRQ